jgi:hypothetical protein
MDDRRSEPRLRAFKAGMIEFGGTGISVRNISATGAALEVASPVGIPSRLGNCVGMVTLYGARKRRHLARAAG